jgi:hypothetical protein
MSGFGQARADLAETMQRLAALDRVFVAMEEFAGMLGALGQHPQLAYDPAVGRITLEVVVGRVPPRITLAVEDAATASLPAPEPVPARQPALRATRLTKFRTGPWSDAELMTATAMIREGRTNKEIAARLNRIATGIHFNLNPLRKDLAAEEPAKIPSETEGVSTAEHSGAPVPNGGSRGSRLASGRTDASGGGSGAAEGEHPAAGGSPAPSVAPPGLTIAERRVWEHLEAIADPEWPPARDLDMLERMMRGDGASATAEGMGLAKSAIVSRWRRLFPGDVTIELQARLVRVLKMRTEAAE